jgi:hypothetical protein
MEGIMVIALRLFHGSITFAIIDVICLFPFAFNSYFLLLWNRMAGCPRVGRVWLRTTLRGVKQPPSSIDISFNRFEVIPPVNIVQSSLQPTNHPTIPLFNLS